MVIDAHAHVSWPADFGLSFTETRDAAQIELGDRLGIDVFVCSCLAPRPSTPETFRAANDRLIAAMREFPGRIWGYCYVNPGYTPEALAEIERCLQIEDMVGVKLYNEYYFDDPVLRPIIEKCVELDCVILEHQGHCTDSLPGQPYISDADHLSRMANAYPEAKIILGHICGGGDWEWTIKALRNAPSVLLDTSGSVTDDGTMEMAAAVLGAERLVFGCDMSMTAGMGRIRAADLSKTDKEKILGGNMMGLLRRRNG